MLIRLNKYIAECGYCSRRRADQLINDKKVFVNGICVSTLGEKIDDEKDEVKVEGNIVKKQDVKKYIMLNKPIGYITTNKEQFLRKATIDLIKEDVRVFPIGRLDKDTEGLLILTNDGEFANNMMHPSHVVEKTYIVTTNSKITDEKIIKLRKGIDIGGYITKEAKVNKISEKEIEIIITEGKNRQIRRMCKAVNINVLNLKRTKYGGIELGNLKIGEYRNLTEEEIKILKNKKIIKK